MPGCRRTGERRRLTRGHSPFWSPDSKTIAFWAGEFANSFVLAKMKVATKGRHLWARTIGSTVVGQGIDSLIFYPLAFYGTGIIPNDKLPLVMLASVSLATRNDVQTFVRTIRDLERDVQKLKRDLDAEKRLVPVYRLET